MKYSFQQSLARLEELDRSLMDPTVLSNSKKIREITKERAQLQPIVDLWTKINEARQSIEEAQEFLSDPEMQEIAEEEIAAYRKEIPELEAALRIAMIPPDPYEGRDIILEIRAGTGGDEAALFAFDLLRMYTRFGNQRGWKLEEMSSSTITVGGSSGKSAVGYKEIICQISGGDAYKHLCHESGVHRVQRVPLTETQGRIHTSAATVAVLPIADLVEVDIKNEDLKIEVMRAGGPGGQSVNTTDSAVRLTHIPSGIVVKCQDEKSQHKNKAKAMKVLAARLLEKTQAAAHEERAANRRSQVGSGDRSERIRTYNYPQNRVTDHRINLTLYKLDRVMEGEMNELVDSLNAHLQEKLAQQYTEMAI